ncbi:helix-turn-helix domain-containing protein [Lysinibacillus xylanilyticus]|uniref:Helix-turn-helix domain-containing protein n=1 Tax=Lysinibacillus xylanilyticus TaxID=582475 RepID=A0ABT4ENS3_9BACI|nr:helix-turn-helix domain-containing protein [Lysinibacillus xylanilyticus]MCY9547271.1 helix-turn-helix domain-containing protein [Lysinibacillus xylanilyticus]
MAFEYLAQYVTFDSTDDMDKEINERIKEDRFNLTKSERAIVFAIKSHCLDYPGTCHLRNETIAKEVGVSLITVSRAIKKLVELKIIGKANRSKLNGIKGANIYYFLPQNDVSDMMHREEVDEASNDKASEEISEDVSIKSFNLLKTSNLQEIYNNAHAEKEAHKEYMNEYQVMLFDFMNSLPLADNLKDELHKCVMASQVNSAPDFIKAKNVLFKIAMDIKEGVLTVASTLRAVFVGAYSKAVERSNIKPNKSSSIEETQSKKRPVPFYDWLNERACRSEICNRLSVYNWLEC